MLHNLSCIGNGWLGGGGRGAVAPPPHPGYESEVSIFHFLFKPYTLSHIDDMYTLLYYTCTFVFTQYSLLTLVEIVEARESNVIQT